MRDFLDPQSFDDFVEEYDFSASLVSKPDFFLSHLPERRERALDVGCGTGILAQELAKQFRSVLAIDISEPMLAFAREKRSAPNLEYRWGDANALDVEGSFDVIASRATFHHLSDVGATLSALRERLAPGGRAILVDNVYKRPVVPAYMIVVGTLVSVPSNLLRYGYRACWRKYQFRLSRRWLAHCASDRFLSERDFRDVYGRALPGATFTRGRTSMGVVWEREAV